MRPELNDNISLQDFNDYYWLKAELTDFCRQKRLSTSGSKELLNQRIKDYLSPGSKNNNSTSKQVQSPNTSREESAKIDSTKIIELCDTIPTAYKNDERHRAFFKSVIGNHFKFNVPFMNWMKTNPGLSYQSAVDMWLKIDCDKKNGIKHPIGKQFEYNQYTRDFFVANPKATHQMAIKCWLYKKTQPGHNKYETRDLIALQRE